MKNQKAKENNPAPCQRFLSNQPKNGQIKKKVKYMMAGMRTYLTPENKVGTSSRELTIIRDISLTSFCI
ncbi:hypothetical protein [Pantoea endophytica]|uniref:hypothetical protein n=1 Tax=Pantoea endophytica TaxID=92488 RepID=UPI003018B75D